MGCRFPGATDLSEYFENILAGKSCTDDLSTEGRESAFLLVREVTLEAIADAGLAADILNKQRVEVLIGSGSDSNLSGAAAGQIKERLTVNGATRAADAAEASSLEALNLATLALVGRRADVAVAGGVLREGVGVVVLKRRADAERDGDRIYAIVQGVGIYGNDRSWGIAVSSARRHVRAMRRAYRSSGIDPASVMLVEGHGIGKPAAKRAAPRGSRRVSTATLRPSHSGRSLFDDRRCHIRGRHGRADQGRTGTLPPRITPYSLRRSAASHAGSA